MPIRVTSNRKTPAARTNGGALLFGLPQPPANTVQKPAGISLCMIVKNEERFLEQCLRSVADVVDEIIIVDTGSTDRTIEIARSFGATVIEREWRNDFAWARNQSIESATRRWILFLDADEELTPESKNALLELKNVPAHRHALFVRCFNESDDYRGTGAMSHSLVRIFPNDERIRFRGLIHEFPTLDNNPGGLPTANSPVAIVHHGYLKDVVAERNKAARNLEIVRAATEQDPSDPYHWFNLGTTAFLSGDFEAARDALEEMRRINGRQPRGFMPNGLAVLAEIYCDKLHEPKKGEEVVHDALAFSPHYANAHFQLGKVLIAQRRFDEARQAFQAAIDDGKHAGEQFVIDDQVYRWKAHSEIGSSYVLQGNDEKAIEWFERGLRNAPGVEPLQINRARALERLGRHDEAEAAFREAHELHADDASTADFVNFLLRRHRGLDALSVIDRAHEKLTDAGAVALLHAAAQIAVQLSLPTAIDYLRLAAERMPSAADILNPLESALRERGLHEELGELLAREAQSEPLLPADFLRRSHQALERGDARLARALADRGLERAPDDARLRYNAALAATRIGDADGAVEHLRRIDAGDPATFAAAGSLLAATLRDVGRLDEAVAAAERLIAEQPANLDAQALRASLYERLGELTMAERSYRALYDIDHAVGGVELASFYLRQQRFADAARIADEALQR